MQHQFYIQSNKTKQSLLNAYLATYEIFATKRFLSNNDHVHCYLFDVKPQYGKGTIRIFEVFEEAILIIYDVCFHEEMHMHFSLSDDYFEVEYCVDGAMRVEEQRSGASTFEKNALSISLAHETNGTIIYPKQKEYQGVSIITRKTEMDELFGTVGLDAWNDTIEAFEKDQRYGIYLGSIAPIEVGNSFIQMYDCQLPFEMRTFFYEGKVMEILALIISRELVKKQKLQTVELSDYELACIQSIPQLLLDQPFELPDVATLAAMFSMSQKQMTSGFKAVYGDTIYRHHRKLSLHKASQLLLNTEKTINDISYEVGYSMPTNFCVAFKNQYGLTPLKYRETSMLRNA